MPSIAAKNAGRRTLSENRRGISRFAILVELAKLLRSIADTDGMDGHYIEPRKVMWAMAEITWEDDSATSFRVPAVLEDTSRSGACVRLKRPLAVGSRITIKWHREQFPAIARNCRTDGGDFLLGVLRETQIVSATMSASHPAAPDAKAERTVEPPSEVTHAIAAPAQTASPAPVRRTEAAPAVVKPKQAPSRGQSRQPFQNAVATAP